MKVYCVEATDHQHDTLNRFEPDMKEAQRYAEQCSAHYVAVRIFAVHVNGRAQVIELLNMASGCIPMHTDVDVIATRKPKLKKPTVKTDAEIASQCAVDNVNKATACESCPPKPGTVLHGRRWKCSCGRTGRVLKAMRPDGGKDVGTTWVMK